jgi:hypothetical protein
MHDEYNMSIVGTQVTQQHDVQVHDGEEVQQRHLMV